MFVLLIGLYNYSFACTRFQQLCWTPTISVCYSFGNGTFLLNSFARCRHIWMNDSWVVACMPRVCFASEVIKIRRECECDSDIRTSVWLMTSPVHDVTLSTHRLPWLHQWQVPGDDVHRVHLSIVHTPPIQLMYTISLSFAHHRSTSDDVPFDAHCFHMGAAIKHPVPDRVNPSFVIFTRATLC